MRHEIFAEVYFCGLAIFCVLRELILAISSNSFFFLVFAIFRKHGMDTLCKTSNSLYTVLFLNERDKL